MNIPVRASFHDVDPLAVITATRDQRHLLNIVLAERERLIEEAMTSGR